MNNVYDILEQKKLMFVLPEDVCQCQVTKDILRTTSVVVYLYYEDTVERYLQYIDNIPLEIKVYIISSNKLIFKTIEKYVSEKKHRFFIPKENRGRDISALLVTAQDIVMESEFCCFIHDKKIHAHEEMHTGIKSDTNLWIKNLWDNTLKSREYILNVLNLFHDKNIGLLVPPEPIGEYRNEWYISSWGDDFENTQKLAKELKLSCNISTDKPPITLGTVFWCRTKALKKLFDKKWRYSDFPQEPLAIDGTISHAIERILAYVAQDAGYNTGIVMCSSYSQTLLLLNRAALTSAYTVLKNELGLTGLYQVREFEKQRKEVDRLFQKSESVYLYGAGYFGRKFMRSLRLWGYNPKGFLVSPGKKRENDIDGYILYEIDNIPEKEKERIGVIITVRYDSQDEFAHNLEEYGYFNYIKCLFNA